MSSQEPTGNQHISLSPDQKAEWQLKLDVLQSQHREETLKQQEDHLEQLRLLQAQLIQDLSVNLSTTSEQKLKETEVNSSSVTLMQGPKDDATERPIEEQNSAANSGFDKMTSIPDTKSQAIKPVTAEVDSSVQQNTSVADPTGSSPAVVNLYYDPGKSESPVLDTSYSYRDTFQEGLSLISHELSDLLEPHRGGETSQSPQVEGSLSRAKSTSVPHLSLASSNKSTNLNNPVLVQNMVRTRPDSAPYEGTDTIPHLNSSDMEASSSGTVAMGRVSPTPSIELEFLQLPAVAKASSSGTVAMGRVSPTPSIELEFLQLPAVAKAQASQDEAATRIDVVDSNSNVTRNTSREEVPVIRSTNELKTTLSPGDIHDESLPNKDTENFPLNTPIKQAWDSVPFTLQTPSPQDSDTSIQSPSTLTIHTPTPLLLHQYSYSSHGKDSDFKITPNIGDSAGRLGGKLIQQERQQPHQSRATLLEKHSKHIEDLKSYYEAELTQLREEMQQKAQEGEMQKLLQISSSIRTPPPLSASPGFVSLSTRRKDEENMSKSRDFIVRGSLSPLLSSPNHTHSHTPGGNTLTMRHSGVVEEGEEMLPAVELERGKDSTRVHHELSVARESEVWMLQSENGRLKSECARLQSLLDESDRNKHILDDQVKRMQQHALEWQERYESSERMVSVLQDRLETTRTQLHNQDRIVGQLQSDLQVTIEELTFWKDQRTQDVEKIDQLFHEFEVLQKENEDLRSFNADFEKQLEEKARDISTMRASLDKYHTLEAQYKSLIQRLEDEVRHLEHIKNRTHSMGTHYELGCTYNQADEEKLSYHHPKHSTHSTSRNKPEQQLTHYEKQPPVVDTKFTTSHDHGSQSPSHRHHTSQDHVTSASTPPIVRPLTRRKWLEPSDPGIFGGSPTYMSPVVNDTATNERLRTDNTTGTARPPHTPSKGHTTPQGSPHHTHKRTPHTHSSHPQQHTQPAHGCNNKETMDSTSRKVGGTAETSPVMRAVRNRAAYQDNFTNEGEDPGYYGKRKKVGRSLNTESYLDSFTNDGGDPGHYEKKNENVVDSALRAVREGTVISSEVDRGYPTNDTYRKSKKDATTSVEERIKKHVQIVSEAECKLAELQAEKEELEFALQRTPKSGGRVSREAKQIQLVKETRLEEVMKAIGSVRMVLRKHHAFKK